MTPWEAIVALAKDIDLDCSKGVPPDETKIDRLARAVLDFQQHLAGPKVMVTTRPIRHAELNVAAE
jgi:hypothetical protein